MRGIIKRIEFFNIRANIEKSYSFWNTSDIYFINHQNGFLRRNNKAKLACDVIENEIENKKNNPLIKFSKKTNQVIISPHIGGMTIEAQRIAYHRVADQLYNYFK